MKISSRNVFVCLGLLLLACLLIALSHGTVAMSYKEVVLAILSLNAEQLDTHQLMINKIRFPRLLLASLIGAMLAVSGAITQGLFRNPLADPSLIGVTAGASAGAALVIVFGAYAVGSFSLTMGLTLVSIGAFLGGMLTVVLVYRLATNQTGTSVATMLLAGIAITALAGALTSLLEFFAGNEMLRRISLWRMGGLEGATFTHVAIAALVLSVIMLRIRSYSTALNALLLGESEAKHLGVDVQRVKLNLILVVAAAVGTAVALAGSIAFVGLVVPHIMRMILGPNHNTLLPASALAGAILLVIADTIARTMLSPVELPVGLVTAIIGAPFFIVLLKSRHQYGMR